MAHRITVKAKDAFRSFKKDYEVIFDFENTNINFLLGKNGCGKSTLIRAIRGTMNSNDDKDKRWAAAADCREILKFFDVDIEGFDKVYHLDADGLDDNLNVQCIIRIGPCGPWRMGNERAVARRTLPNNDGKTETDGNRQ